MTPKETTVPKTAPLPTREQLEQEAEAAATRAAELRAQMWEADQTEERRRLEAERRFDEQLVASYSRARLEAEVDEAHAAFDQALATNPLVLAAADYLTALRRRSHGVNEHLAALARLGRPTGGASLPSAELGSLMSYVERAAERLATERLARETADLCARRDAAGDDDTTTKGELMTTTTALVHEAYCLPRPGEDAPRIEIYRVPRYADDGTTQIASVRCVRCVDCGVISYDNRQPGV